MAPAVSHHGLGDISDSDMYTSAIIFDTFSLLHYIPPFVVHSYT